MSKKIELTEEMKTQILELSAKGYIDKEICQCIGIGKSLFYEWLNENVDFADSLRVSKRKIDSQVEQKLFKRAMGYRHEEIIKELVKDEDSNLKEMKVTRIITKEERPDVTAQIFWLKNRQPQRWRDKQEIKHSGGIEQKADASITEKINKLLELREKDVK